MVMVKNNQNHRPDGKGYAINVDASYEDQSEIRTIYNTMYKENKIFS